MTRRTSAKITAMAILLMPLTAAAPTPVGAATPTGAESVSPLRFELDISERKLYVRHGTDVQTYPVAVGSDEYPTPTGHFTISEVTWNPDWRPPSSEWSEDESFKAPDDPDNPMGRAKLMFKAPDYTIHGTDALESLGKNVSHGSVRIANDIVTQLARSAMAHGGARKSEQWHKQAAKDDSDQHGVELPNPIPISVHQ